MGAARKLQGEIDRCLKKVQEGIDEFDQIWQKVHDTENANQKEKFEADLKKEIKKLQRLRDQIKSWISGADIKDKSALVEARKAIEREMERFKTCEKEAKMKQFSKAALGQADRLDPKEQAKMESREWINDMVDKLNVRIEQFEYEMEELQAGLKKKAKPPPKLVQLEEVVTVHKKHTLALEKALRCLDNDAITSEEIDPLKDDLDYYIAMELDEHYDNTDDMYCEIADRLEAVEAAAPAASTIGAIATHISAKAKDGKAKGSGGGGKDDEDVAKEKERERERAAAAAVKAQLIAQGNSNVKLPEDDDRPKPSLPTPRPSALVSMGSGSLPPLSPIGTTPSAAAGFGGLISPSATMVPPSPTASNATLPTPRSSGEVPHSPAAQARATPTAAESPPDSSSTAAIQNGPTAVSPVTPPPPPPAAPSTPAAPAAAATTPVSRPGMTLASVVSSGLREQQQQLELPAQPAPPQQQQQQQQQAPAVAPPAAAAATPAGGRLGAWMAGVPESAKQATAQQQQQQAVVPTAASILQKGIAPAAAAAATPAAAFQAAGIKPGAPAAAAPQQAQQQQQQQQGPPPQQQQQQAAASPDKVPAAADAAPTAAAAAAQNGPLVPAAAAAATASSAAADLAAAAAAAGVSPAVLDGVSGVALLEGWSRMAASELGLGTAMHSQVPRGMMALPVLEACMRSALPQPSDSDWNKPKPRHPIVGPASYPKTQPDVISAPGLFRKMDPEALFFAFYYQPDTYQQYLAAQELKRQSWRYHKHHNAWFQRYAEPTVTSEEYEQGTYVYFDYNIMHDDLQTGWCYRRKENFTFRYDALEDELPVQAV